MVSPSPFLPDLSHLSNYPIPFSLLLPPPLLGNEQKHAKGKKKHRKHTHLIKSQNQKPCYTTSKKPVRPKKKKFQTKRYETKVYKNIN